MYQIINKRPSNEQIISYKMSENANEAYINFKVDLGELTIEQRKELMIKYQLEQNILTYKESLFLSIPVKA